MSSSKEIIELALKLYSGEFKGSEEKQFIESVYGKFGISIIMQIYEDLNSWEERANFVKYFLRDDTIISDKIILLRFQEEYYKYLLETNQIIDFCTYTSD